MHAYVTYQINSRSRTFGSGAKRARFAVSANRAAPSAPVFLGSGDAQRAVGVIAVRA